MKKTMTEGSIAKTLFFFSLPIMLGHLLQQLYNTVDGIVVGNYVSQNALAAVGGCGSLTMLLLAISMGMSGGGSIIVAQYYGAKRMDEMRRSVSTLLIMLSAMGVLFSAIGVIFARGLVAGILNVTDPEIYEMTVTYFRVYAFGLIVQYLYNAISSILRALGDSKSTLYFLCISAVINVVLDLVFVLCFNWGVFGVAIATVISQVACTVASLIYMLKRYPMFRFGKGEFVFDVDKFKIALRLGVPATIQNAVTSLGHVFIQRLVNSFGAATMTAFAVGHRMESYAMIPLFSTNMAISTFTGQNVGAGKFDRAKKGLWTGIGLVMLFIVVICPLLYIFATPLSQLFGTEGEALRQSVEMLRFMAIVMPLFSLYMPTNSFLSGAGDAITSTVAMLTTLAVRVLTAYVLAYVFMVGYKVAWITMPIGWIVAACISYGRYFSGKWKSKAIVKHDEETLA